MNIRKMLRILLFSIFHLGLTVVFMIATAFQLRIIDIPNGGEAVWSQLIIPAVWGVLISPFVALCAILLPQDFIKNTQFAYLQFVINSIIWEFLLKSYLAS